MPAKRVLFLGITGIDKRQVLQRLAQWLKINHGEEWIQVDFEEEYLFNENRGGLKKTVFLDADLRRQNQQWRLSWEELCKARVFRTKNNKGPDQFVFLSMHGCFTRKYYGVRALLDPHSVGQDFQPDLIVTLIQDLYDVWGRTEARAGAEAWRGRPSLEELLYARRHELVVGDQVAMACSNPRKNLMLAVGHPCETLGHRIHHPDPRVVYLSFPISEPRRMLSAGDSTGMDQVSAFIKRAYEFQHSHPNLVFQCPLGIDELPLRALLRDLDLRAVEDDEGELREVTFDSDAARWNLDSVWPRSERLALPADTGKIQLKAAQLHVVAGNIRTDVTWRDYRLVDQADCLAVFNPIFNNRASGISRGVRNEITFASSQGKPVYIYQDPAHDSKDMVGQVFASTMAGGGTMERPPTDGVIVRKNSEAELLQALVG